MSANSKIEWTDHTFNPWIGCTKVSPGCENCYAARQDTFRRWTPEGWGGPRKLTKTWGDPVKWNKAHAAFFAEHGRRQRVFCASLADVFDNEVDSTWRSELFMLISETPNLDWLILTKRIGNASKMLPAWYQDPDAWEFGNGVAHPNVWLGATVVNQEEADRDIPKLLAVPAAKRFLSMEPLLGPVDIGKYVAPWTCSNCQHWGSEGDSGPCKCADCDIESVYDESIGSDRCPQCGKDNGQSDVVAKSCPSCEQSGGWQTDDGFRFDAEKPSLLDWIIAGGESGPGARPSHPDWYRSLRDQCAAAGVPFLFKQWGEWMPPESRTTSYPAGDWRDVVDATGEVRKVAYVGDRVLESSRQVVRVGKKAAGRVLDGIEHNGFPV